MGCLVESGACPAFFSTVSVSVFFFLLIAGPTVCSQSLTQDDCNDLTREITGRADSVSLPSKFISLSPLSPPSPFLCSSILLLTSIKVPEMIVFLSGSDGLSSRDFASFCSRSDSTWGEKIGQVTNGNTLEESWGLLYAK